LRSEWLGPHQRGMLFGLSLLLTAAGQSRRKSPVVGASSHSGGCPLRLPGVAAMLLRQTTQGLGIACGIDGRVFIASNFKLLDQARRAKRFAGHSTSRWGFESTLMLPKSCFECSRSNRAHR